MDQPGAGRGRADDDCDVIEEHRGIGEASLEGRMNKVTIPELLKRKREGRKITMLTAYDFPFARIVDEAGIDIILVGDSLGVVVQGQPNTLNVTMEEMLYHTRIVARGVGRALVVGDMPFLS